MSRAELERLASIARDAGRGILRLYESDFRVDFKSPGDPVTDADREANTLICSRLAAEFPGAAIVAEESAAEHYAGYRTQERVFFVDPLDGTREYVAKNGQFVVMIGLLIDDVASLGVVYQPTTGTLWCGARGIGAFRVDADGSERPIRVGSVTQPEESKVTVSRSRRSDPLKLALERIGARQVIPMGSAGLKGALVAESLADAYLAVGVSGKYWDACAMDAIVSAAGGRVSDARGAPL
ncbi:MAG TPA: 3'(2'),5'-bisphosphate nucleotidase CysQ, partial [Polyangiaceae bacterium]|nr:3'(2'),5'-bisphosphate nucleotidase CysQ [Polyangiaceae bacterium]